MAVDKRVLGASLATALIISVGGGYLLSRSGDDPQATTVGSDDDVTITSNGVFLEPSLGVNKAVEGDTLPSVDLLALDGTTVSTDSLRGTPVVLNIWATNCVACKTEMPALAAIDDDLAGSVRFVGVNLGDSASAASSFAADKNVHYELLSDQLGDLVADLGVTGLPYTLFIAPDGTIVSQKGIGLDEAEIRSAITELLAVS